MALLAVSDLLSVMSILGMVNIYVTRHENYRLEINFDHKLLVSVLAEDFFQLVDVMWLL